MPMPTTVTVTVTNVNDNTPVLTSSTHASVVENQTAVQTVTATDADADVLTFSITGGADQALFAIDGSSGALSFQPAPDYEMPTDADGDNVYVLQVTASDGLREALHTVSVTVTNVNDNTPALTSATTVRCSREPNVGADGDGERRG